jgi:hypothetical protein
MAAMPINIFELNTIVPPTARAPLCQGWTPHTIDRNAHSPRSGAGDRPFTGSIALEHQQHSHQSKPAGLPIKRYFYLLSTIYTNADKWPLTNL